MRNVPPFTCDLNIDGIIFIRAKEDRQEMVFSISKESNQLGANTSLLGVSDFTVWREDVGGS